MGNVVDYVRREFRGFGELAFSNVDSLVLSELSYMRLPGLVPAFGEAKSVAIIVEPCGNCLINGADTR